LISIARSFVLSLTGKDEIMIRRSFLAAAAGAAIFTATPVLA